MAKHTLEEYREVAYNGLFQLISAEHAVVWDEVEAKLAEQVWRDLPFRIQPHHLTTARDRLGINGDGIVIERHPPPRAAT